MQYLQLMLFWPLTLIRVTFAGELWRRYSQGSGVGCYKPHRCNKINHIVKKWKWNNVGDVGAMKLSILIKSYFSWSIVNTGSHKDCLAKSWKQVSKLLCCYQATKKIFIDYSNSLNKMNLRNISPKDDFNTILEFGILGFQIPKTISYGGMLIRLLE